MSTVSDILIEYSKDSLELMLNILKHKLPQKIRQYNFLYSYLYHYDKININRDKIYSDRWNVKFYGHRNGKIENCTILTINGKMDYIITVFTLEESQDEIKECLQKTNLINWNNNNLNILCDESLFKTVKEVVSHRGIDWIYPSVENVLIITESQVEDLSIIDLPQDLHIAPLDPEKHSKIIDDHWYYKHANSLSLIQHSIEMNGGLGIFHKGDDQPICWITTNEFLAPGFLFTLEQERKKGYAGLILMSELNRLSKLHKKDLLSFVSVENEASLALHYKLGFKTIDRVTWIEKPKTKK